MDSQNFLECVTGLPVQSQDVDFGANAVVLVASGYPHVFDEEPAVLGPLTIALRLAMPRTEA